MIDGSLLLTAWYDLLDISVDVYKENPPESQEENYVILRVESGTAANNKRSFNDEVIVVCDVVTFFENDIDRSVAERIDKEVCDLVLPTMQTGLSASGIQILNVKRDSFEYLQESGVKKVFRKISRWYHRVHQI